MKTLIILHGWQSSKEKWQKIKELMEKDGIETIIPDLPGFKPETDLSKPWKLDDYVNWFKNFRKNREIFFLMGHSFGGRIAIKFAEKYPQKLRGIILVSAAGLKKQKTIFDKILNWGAYTIRILKIEEMPQLKGLRQILRKFFYRFILRKTDYFYASGFLKETIKNILDEDLTLLLAKISVPTMIIWGKKDKITPLSDGYLMKEKIKNSKIEILDNIGHTPHLEAPELLAEKITQFVK